MPNGFSSWRRAHNLSLFMAAVMFLSPLATLKAQSPTGPPANGFDTKYITPDTALVAYLRPQQLLASPKLEMLPTELATAAGNEILGFDAANIIEAVFVAEPPVDGPPQLGIILRLSEKFDINNLPAKVRAGTVEDVVGGRKYFKAQHAGAPSFFMPNDTTLYIASQGMLRKQFARDKEPAQGPLVDTVKASTGTEDLVVVADVQKLLPFVGMGMVPGEQLPPQFHEFLEAPEHVQLVDLAVNVTQPGKSHLMLHATSAKGADKLEDLMNKAIAMGQEQTKLQSQMMAASDDPIEAAMGRYGLRVADKIYEPFKPQRQGDKFVIVETDFNDPQGANQMALVAIVGVLVALGLPAVQAARAGAQRNEGMNNIKMHLLAMHNYHEAYNRFPAHASYSADGKPLLSWRVHLLPYMEGEGAALYNQFKLDEPWDSEHNKKLIDQMPEEFLSPNSANAREAGLTNYVAPVGEGLLFDGTENGTKMQQISDGLSNTIALLEVDDEHAVPWTAPEDWEYDEENPTKGLFGLHPGGALTGWADGHVEILEEHIDIETLLALLTIAGGEVVDY